MDKHQTMSRLALSRKVEKFDFTKYGIDDVDGIYIKKLSAAERSKLLELYKAEAALSDIQTFVITAALVDSEGNKIFDDPENDGKAIGKNWSCDLVDELNNHILNFSRAIKAGESGESAEKN